MTNTEKCQALQRAIDTIREVEESLDYSFHQCEGCKLVVRENYTEARLRENLSAIGRKLNRILHSIRSW